jgi:hypothetical protein
MHYETGRGILERGASANLWRNTLSGIPSVFGRLVYLSAMRDPNTGRYWHSGLEQVFGEKESDRALRQSHTEAFSEWLCYDLEQQKADLELYLSGLPEKRSRIVETWARLKPYRNLVPTSAVTTQVELYLVDLETLLQLLKNEYGVCEPD